MSREGTVPVDKNTTKVGFIGLGIMGAPMAGHIMDGGYALHVYNRTKASAEDLIGRGAQWHDSPAEVARTSPTRLHRVQKAHSVRC